MKTIKTLCIALLALTFSCSSDDDNNTPNVETGFFPKKITKTSVTEPTLDRSYNFTYNSDNQISNISIVYPEGEIYRNYSLSYSNGKLTSAVDGEFSYTFMYSSENRLNSIVIGNDLFSVTVPVGFNDATNTYSFTLEGEIQYTINEEETIPLAYYTETNECLINHSSTPGIFAEIPLQVGLGFMFPSIDGLDYFFFHPFEVESYTYNDATWSVTNTIDTNGTITSITANSPFGVRTYTIEYEQREL